MKTSTPLSRTVRFFAIVTFLVTITANGGAQATAGSCSSCASCQCQSCGCGLHCECWCLDAMSFELSDEMKCKMESLEKRMVESGVIYAVGATQFYQGVTDGGAAETWEYGGKVDQFLMLDSCKLGLWKDTTMILHAETRFGDDINFQAAPFAPANVAMLYPKSGEHDTAITGLTFDQKLSTNTHVLFGKFNALDLMQLLYPQTGRGIDGFMNASNVINMSLVRLLPLSFLGAGMAKYRGEQVQGALLVYDTNNIPTTSGFDELFNNGVNILGFWRFFTNVGGLPGSHAFAGIWSSGEFVAFDPSGFIIIPPNNIVAPREDGAYTLIYNLEQTLWADPCNKERNIALLSQWGYANQKNSPVHWSMNVAIQATGVNACRPKDALGVGYFHTEISSDLQNLLSPLFTIGDLDGFEVYYKAHLSEVFSITANFQVIEPALVNRDTAVVAGLRATIGM